MESSQGLPQSSLKESKNGASEEVATQMELYGYKETFEEAEDYDMLEGNIEDSDLVKAGMYEPSLVSALPTMYLAETEEKKVKAQEDKFAGKTKEELENMWFDEEYSPYGRVEKDWGAAEKTGDEAKKG